MKKASTIRSIFTIFGILAALLIILSGCKNAQQKQEVETPSSEIPSSKEEVIEEFFDLFLHFTLMVEYIAG